MKDSVISWRIRPVHGPRKIVDFLYHTGGLAQYQVALSSPWNCTWTVGLVQIVGENPMWLRGSEYGRIPWGIVEDELWNIK